MEDVKKPIVSVGREKVQISAWISKEDYTFLKKNNISPTRLMRAAIKEFRKPEKK